MGTESSDNFLDIDDVLPLDDAFHGYIVGSVSQGRYENSLEVHSLDNKAYEKNASLNKKPVPGIIEPRIIFSLEK